LDETQLADVAVVVLMHDRQLMPVAQRLFIEQIRDPAVSCSVHPASGYSDFSRARRLLAAAPMGGKISIGSGISPH
jgi:hypothetical protein